MLKFREGEVEKYSESPKLFLVAARYEECRRVYGILKTTADQTNREVQTNSEGGTNNEGQAKLSKEDDIPRNVISKKFWI